MPTNNTMVKDINSLLAFIDSIKKYITMTDKSKARYLITTNICIFLSFYLISHMFNHIINVFLIISIVLILWLFNTFIIKLYNSYEKYDSIIDEDINFLHKLSREELKSYNINNTNVMKKILNHISKYIHICLIIKFTYALSIFISFISLIFIAINSNF